MRNLLRAKSVAWIVLLTVVSMPVLLGYSTAAVRADSPAETKAAEAGSASPAAEAKVEADQSKPAAETMAEKSAAASNGAPAEAAKAAAKPKRNKVRLALLTLKNELPESTGEIGPFSELQINLRQFVGRIDKAANDDSIAGLVLDVRNPSLGRAKIEEIREAIKRFRTSGKKAYAQVESATPTDYLIACACDEIVMPEAGMVVLPGIHAQAMFYKGMLGKLGIRADFIHMGAYKGAAEPLMREKYSKPVRENMTALVDGLYDQFVTTIVKDRPLTIAQVKEVIDTGLLTAPRAKELGLIDRIAYPDALRADLADTYEAAPLVYVENYGRKKLDTDFSGPMGFLKLLQTIMGEGEGSRRSRGKKIAVVYALGPITTGKSESTPFGGAIMGSTTIVQALRDAADDDKVVAIVLRIDSPGGSALASDLIWHQTQVIEKPIVASMGDVAASGGYYIAMGADRIIAAPGTLTGSIGVVGGKLAIGGLLDKVGISTDTIQRGKNSSIFSGTGKFTDSEREVLTTLLKDIYGQFTSKAAKGRHMPLDQLVELAGGRVYTGAQAKANGLVDDLGTLQDAIKSAKQLAGLQEDEKVELEILPEPTNFLEQLFGEAGAEKEVRVNLGLETLTPELVDLARRAYQLRAVFAEPAAAVMPFELDIR